MSYEDAPHGTLQSPFGDVPHGTLQSPFAGLAHGTLQSPFGLGATEPGDPSNWCSDQNPQGTCKPLVNICKPMNSATLAGIKTLQRQTNALLSKIGKTLLDVDGRVGPKTMGAVNSILGTNFSHCDELMFRLNSLAGSMATRAASEGVVPPRDPRPKSPPSQPGAGGTVIHPPNDQIKQAGFGAVLTSPIGLAALVVGGLLIWKATDKPKKKTKKKKPRRKGRQPKRRITTSYF